MSRDALARLIERNPVPTNLRERVTALRVTAARLHRKSPARQGEVIDQSKLTLGTTTGVDAPAAAVPSVSGCSQTDLRRPSIPGGSEAGANDAGGDGEIVMGRHEQFATGTPIDADLLSGTALGEWRQREEGDEERSDVSLVPSSRDMPAAEVERRRRALRVDELHAAAFGRRPDGSTPGAAPDPVLALIAAHRLAWDAFGEAGKASDEIERKRARLW